MCHQQMIYTLLLANRDNLFMSAAWRSFRRKHTLCTWSLELGFLFVRWRAQRPANNPYGWATAAVSSGSWDFISNLTPSVRYYYILVYIRRVNFSTNTEKILPPAVAYYKFILGILVFFVARVMITAVMWNLFQFVQEMLVLTF